MIVSSCDHRPTFPGSEDRAKPTDRAKPKPTGKKAERPTPDEQMRRYADLCERLEPDDVKVEAKPKPGKLGAEKLTPEEQRRRFEELAREAGCDETSEERFDRALAVLGRRKPDPRKG